ncbi:MAG: hypothetical protein ABL974_03560 [Prosthecobacter sp.]
MPKAEVRHVVGVVHFAVEHLQAHGDAKPLAEGHEFRQASSAVLNASLVSHASASAGHADDFLETRVGGLLNQIRVTFHQHVMELGPVPAADDVGFRQLLRGEAPHCALQAVLEHRGIVRRLQQLDGLDAHAFAGLTKLIKRDSGKRRATDGVPQPCAGLGG